MEKSERQNAILEIITDRSIASQDELASSLAKRGFSVTQASISRDVAELGVTKQKGRYYPPPSTSILAKEPVSIGLSGDSLIVIRCRSGMASAITVEIDSRNIPGVAGTIAGDDTIFIAVVSATKRKTVLKELERLTNGV